MRAIPMDAYLHFQLVGCICITIPELYGMDTLNCVNTHVRHVRQHKLML